MKKSCTFLYSLLIFFWFTLFAFTSAAQNDSIILEEVLVFAVRDERNNQKVDVAVTALTSKVLGSNNISNVVDIGPVVPGLVVSSYNSAKPQFFIRGIGSTGTSASEDSSVSVMSDDVYLGRTGANALNFHDLERVEVLRGPQGTLFGRNSAGGIIHLISKKPSEKLEGYIEASFGKFDYRGFNGAIGGPLRKSKASSTLARSSISYAARDGYVTNLTTDSENLRESKDLATRIHIKQTWSEHATALFTFDYSDSNQLGPSARNASTDQNPLIFGGLVPLPQPLDDIHSVTLAVDAPTNRASLGSSIKVDIDTKFGDFVSISDWRNNKNDLFEDISGVGLILLGQDEDSEHVTQEFRLSDEFNNTFSWTVGAFYLYENVDRIDQVNLTPISDIYSLSPVLPDVPDQVVFYDQNANSESYALFAQTDYSISDALSLVTGARYTWDKKKLVLITTGSDTLSFGLLENGVFTGRIEDEFSQFTGRLSLNYEFGDDLLSYLSFSQGYKAGGFDGTATSLENLEASFNAETADAAEWGVKSEWFENKLRVNTAVFYTDYNDLQVFQVRNTGTQFISNAAAAEVQGLEVEVSAVIANYNRLSLSCAYLDAEYKEFISTVDADGDGAPDDLSGNRLTRSPETACSMTVNYRPVIGRENPLEIYLQYSWQGDIFITPQNRPFDTVEAFGLLNVNVSYALADCMTITAYGKNLTDEEYKLHAFDADPILQNNVQSSVYGDPLTWGLKLRYAF